MSAIYERRNGIPFSQVKQEVYNQVIEFAKGPHMESREIDIINFLIEIDKLDFNRILFVNTNKRKDGGNGSGGSVRVHFTIPVVINGKYEMRLLHYLAGAHNKFIQAEDDSKIVLNELYPPNLTPATEIVKTLEEFGTIKKVEE